MASEPQRKSEAAPGAEGKVQDPWGLRRAEKLLTSLAGVLSARVVANPVGEVTEVHVLTQAGTPPKQVVRNVESALLAQLGLKIDHRKISVAQTASVEPIDVLEEAAVALEARKRGVLFQRVDVRAGSRKQRVVMVVTLGVGGNEVTGEFETADSEKARVQGAARATVAALDRVLPQGTLELEGAMILQAFGMEFAFVGVQVVVDRGTRLLVGTCEVNHTPEEAAALAVLDATNRWLQTRR